MLAVPGGVPPSVRVSWSSPGPAARWIAPSTPPPPSSDEFAALTIASTRSVVMSARTISTRPPSQVAIAAPGSAGRRPDLVGAEVRPEHLGDADRAVALLVRLEDRRDRARQREP